MQTSPANEHSSAKFTTHNRDVLLHGSKLNEVLSLAEIEQYGVDSFGDSDYISIYGMKPREWYGLGIRLLGRTAVECTRDPLADLIARHVAAVARQMPSEHLVIIDPFAGSCNTLFWILRQLPHPNGIGFESDPQVFELTRRNLAILDQGIELLNGDYAKHLPECHVPEDRGIITFVAPPWGTALDEHEGLDLSRTTTPVNEIIEELVRRFSKHTIVFEDEQPISAEKGGAAWSACNVQTCLH